MKKILQEIAANFFSKYFV